jgi:hypothetical protein
MRPVVEVHHRVLVAVHLRQHPPPFRTLLFRTVPC